MDVRIWALAAVVVFFFGLASFTGYFSKLDTAQAALAEAQKELKKLEDEIADNVSSADSKLADLEELTQLVAVHDGLVSKQKTLSDEIQDLEGRKSAGSKVFRDIVVDVRSKSTGIQWADVPFRNGQILREVRIQKITDTEVTLAHAEGIAKLSADELPADLKDRLRLGMEPFLSAPASTSSVVPIVATTNRPTGAARLVTTPTEVEAEINANDARIVSMENTRTQWVNRVSNFRVQAANAKSAGRPTYTLNQQAAEAEKQLFAVEQQISQLRLESDRLRSKLIQVRNDFIKSKVSGSQR